MVTTPGPGGTTSSPPRWAAATAGLISAALALGLSELLAGAIGPAPSLIRAVGKVVIDTAPISLREWAIQTFGTNDKLVLQSGIAVVAALLGAALGIAAARRPRAAPVGFGGFGLLGVLAAAGDPATSLPLALGSAAVSAGAGVLALRRLSATAIDAPSTGADVDAAAMTRRRFLSLAAAVAAVAAGTAVVGRELSRGGRAAVTAARAALRLPPVAKPLPPVPAGAALDIDGLTPFVTPNRDFYRIDTALEVPRVDPHTWRLKVTGLVDRPLELTLDDLMAMEQVESDITLMCVSNEVGGDLIGNARWQGVRLRDVLAMAGPFTAATQVVGRSVDGWDCGFPTAIAMDGRDALIALGMNGELLPLEHGFPARLVVPGLYGYVSATKWLAEIELTTRDDFDGYWIPRGWSKDAPVKTHSRIDVPRAGDLPAGRTMIAGVAWAQHRGIDRVEVQVDDGPWQPARLADEATVECWRQWMLVWDATPGRHVLRVRATDRTGTTQPPERRDVMPDGATGYHFVRVSVG